MKNIICLMSLLFMMVSCISEPDTNWYDQIMFKGKPVSAPLVDTNLQLSSITYPLNLSQNDSIDIWPIPRSFDSGKFQNCAFDSTKIDSLEIYAFSHQKFTGRFWEIPQYWFFDYFDDYEGMLPPPNYKPKYDSVSKIPVLIKNVASSFSILELHDAKLLVIQEAKTRDGKWKPIELFDYSGCGNSTGYIQIPKNGILLFGVNKYSGTFKTKIRVRLSSASKIHYSNEYDGTINEELFIEREMYGFGHNRYLNN